LANPNIMHIVEPNPQIFVLKEFALHPVDVEPVNLLDEEPQFVAHLEAVNLGRMNLEPLIVISELAVVKLNFAPHPVRIL